MSAACLLSVSQSCRRLQQLDLSSNDLDDVNELNHLIPLQFLQSVSLSGCPLVDREGSHVFYRARVLRRLVQIQQLDDEEVTAKEKVKALVMHGSDLETRQRVFTKYLPSQQFTNFLYATLTFLHFPSRILDRASSVSSPSGFIFMCSTALRWNSTTTRSSRDSMRK